MVGHRHLAMGALGFAGLLFAGACGTSSQADTFVQPTTPNGTSDGGSRSDFGVGNLDAGPYEPGTLKVIVRDFRKYDPADPTTNPDFENVPDNPSYEGEYAEYGPEYGSDADFHVNIVSPVLGTDRKPVYNTQAAVNGFKGRTMTTHGKQAFDQWYRDVPGTNVARIITLRLEKNEYGVYSFDSAVTGVPLSAAVLDKQFFPIDDGSPFATPFGNQGLAHNYHFTVEAHTVFTYQGNEAFSFSGDDDVFVYINGKLVINIGGIHSRLVRTVKLPEIADSLGLVVGGGYTLDVFQAERHVILSNFRIDTTLFLSPVQVR